MNGLIALVGAGEYLPVMDGIDRHLLSSVNDNGRSPRVVCLPTAAGQEGQGSVERWMRMGREHFAALGAAVEALPIVDHRSADDGQYDEILEAADLIYFSGGNPGYLYESLAGSRAWDAARRAWARGAVYAGCSAGAMILGKRIPNMRKIGVGERDGFGIIDVQYVLPHFDHAGPFRAFVSLLRHRLKEGQSMIGIDENTAMVGKSGEVWQVMGTGRVHLLGRQQAKSFKLGDRFRIP
jgi:cyanophycinase